MSQNQKIIFDKPNKFVTVFDMETGFRYSSGIIEKGKETDVDPFMAQMPLLIDIGIMGGCTAQHLCNVGCYQQGAITAKKHMPFSKYKQIIDEVKHTTCSIALGGFGNPNDHPEFEKILKYTRESGIVPDYTTAGNTLKDWQIEVTKKYCGAVAVSAHNLVDENSYTNTAIKRFIKGGVTTNIHFVLGNDTLDDAIYRLENNEFPEGINAVIFLLYKPVGKVKDNNVINFNDPRVRYFYSLTEDTNRPFVIGFDACNVPALMNFTTKFDKNVVGSCDAARFSCYITADSFALPCSFDTTTRKWAVSLWDGNRYVGLKSAWNGDIFSKYRNHAENSCSDCKVKSRCAGGCGLMGQEINLCDNPEMDLHYLKVL